MPIGSVGNARMAVFRWLTQRGRGADTLSSVGRGGVYHGGVCSSVLDTNPRGVGGGSGRGGGGGGVRKIFSILGAFLNSPFHSEHFEYTQVE